MKYCLTSQYRSFGLSFEHVRKTGSLVVAWTPAELAMLPNILEENREAGQPCIPPGANISNRAFLV